MLLLGLPSGLRLQLPAVFAALAASRARAGSVPGAHAAGLPAPSSRRAPRGTRPPGRARRKCRRLAACGNIEVDAAPTAAAPATEAALVGTSRLAAAAPRCWRGAAAAAAAAAAGARQVRRRAGAAGAADAPGGPFLDGTTGPLLLLVLAVLYGGNVPLIKSIELETPLDLTAPELLFLRFATVALVVMPWAVANADKVRAVLLPAAELAVWLFLGYALQILALDKTSASTCSVAAASTGVIVQGLEFVFDGKPISPRVALFSAGTIAGIALFVTAPVVVTPGSAVQSILDRIFSFLVPAPKLPHDAIFAGVPGEAIALAGAVFFACHVWRCNRIISNGDSSGRLAGSDFELAIATAQSLLAALLCAVFTLVDSPYALGKQLDVLNRLDANTWLEIFACGAVCTAAPAVLELFAFRVVNPALSSLIYCTIPLWGTVLGVIFLREPFGLQEVVSGIIILVCSLTPSLLDILSVKASEEAEKDA